jgi:two-component system sensor histidine kinase KdpD
MPELRDQVFKKFYRATSEGDKKKPSGTGMGLAIAQGIVEAHGGRIWIDDSAGGGARFNVELSTDGDVIHD